MSRRRAKPKNVTNAGGSSGNRTASQAKRSAATGVPAETQSTTAPPSRGVRAALSFFVTLHLFALLISFTSVVEPSSLHSQLSSLVHPYLRPTHFAADDRPVYLSHGQSDEQPHRVQVTKQPITELTESGEADWVTVGPGEQSGFAATPGLAVSDRVVRWLVTAAMLAENDQPSMVADLMLPLVQNDNEIQGIRIVRFPTDLSDINAENETPYVARVIRKDDSVSLVQLNEKRLSSTPINERKVSPIQREESKTKDAQPSTESNSGDAT
ncbi:MAG: hypothetical protein ACR2NZ_08820 [Rubripirellula sp.]